MDHLKILKRAWDIVRKYRVLWLIGLVLVLAGGAVGSGFGSGAPGGSSPSGSSGGGSGGGDEWQWDGPGPQNWDMVWKKVAPIVIAILIVVAVIVVLAILIGIIKLFVRYVARTSLIEMVQRYEESGEQLGFWAGLRLGWSRSAFYLFLTNLLLKVPLILLTLMGMLIGTALVVVLIVLGVSVANSSGGGMAAAAIAFIVAAIFIALVLLLPLFLIGALVRIAISLVREISYRVCILEDTGPWEAIVEALGLIRRNLWPAVLQYLLMLGLGIAWNIVLFVVNLPLVFMALLIAGLPSLTVGGLIAWLGSAPIAGGVVGGLLFILVMIVVIGIPNILFSTFATVYHSTAWTLTYRELRVIDEGEQEAEIVEVKVEEPAEIDDAEGDVVEDAEVDTAKES
jgi:hypothetical protein